ncbi:MAG: hypothetical protein COT81_05740 [Candidatus Buchananbacteria bacterium CG10_big_fil_rev_8_21_14_0_10_42_9]|uniref:DUF4870 domain-containing protein n=1 Tax=Candidatus Buchananbacteria bacterium CG10_big_fil_rev_8_21_14_0_10_42_9 TaxID=1974526 RepID=A0A2H0W243_9BACT|nr:MAG: hypothetical protein COT81_05740 [Candidatus Buchananbacteria bacterium CG10_big_fil_rev_8_21_14_0_10_42_9]
MAENKSVKPEQGDKLWAAASYIWVLSIVVWALKRKSPFVHGHARQGVVLFIGMVLGIIPAIGWVVALASVVLAIIGLIKAINGEVWEAPVAGAIADKLNL